MIEIKCSKKQKATIISSLQNPNGCLWPQRQSTCWLDPNMDCQKCFETRIKWIRWEKKKENTYDTVPVVRCGKCRYARNAGFRTITGNEAYWCVNNTRIGCTQVLDSDDFCSYGEEKEVVE